MLDKLLQPVAIDADGHVCLAQVLDRWGQGFLVRVDVAIAGGVEAGVNIQVEGRAVGNNVGIEQDRRGRLVPSVKTLVSRDVETSERKMKGKRDDLQGEQGPVVVVHELRVRVLDLVDLIEVVLCHDDLVRDVSGNGDVGEIGSQRNLAALGVNHEVDIAVDVGLVDGAGYLVQVDVDVATHDDQFLAVLCKVRVHAHGKRNIGECSAGIDADLAGVLAHLLDHEPGCVFARKSDVGEAFVEGRV